MLLRRYSFDVALEESVSREGVKDPSERTKIKKEVRKVFEERYKAGKNKWYATCWCLFVVNMGSRRLSSSADMGGK